MKQLNDKIITWLKHHNIDKLSPDKQYLKIIEEVGELAKGLLYEKHNEIKDAIGDIYVAVKGLSLQIKLADLKLSYSMNEAKTFDIFNRFVKEITSNYIFIDISVVNIYLNEIAKRYNLTLKECVEHAYNEIKDRDIKIKNGVAVKTDKDDFKLGDSRTEKIKIFDRDDGTYFEELVMLQEVNLPNFCICGNYKTEPFSKRRFCKLCGKEAKVK